MGNYPLPIHVLKQSGSFKTRSLCLYAVSCFTLENEIHVYRLQTLYIDTAVMWCLEALPRLEAASRQNFYCLGLGLGLDSTASVLLLPRGTNEAETNFSSKAYCINQNRQNNVKICAIIPLPRRR